MRIRNLAYALAVTLPLVAQQHQKPVCGAMDLKCCFTDPRNPCGVWMAPKTDSTVTILLHGAHLAGI